MDVSILSLIIKDMKLHIDKEIKKKEAELIEHPISANRSRKS